VKVVRTLREVEDRSKGCGRLQEFSKKKGVEVRCKISQRRREGKKEREAMIVTTIKEEGV
jgi:hypothetical protein